MVAVVPVLAVSIDLALVAPAAQRRIFGSDIMLVAGSAAVWP